MAWSDVRDRENLEGVLVACVEFRNVFNGIVYKRYVLGDRYMKITLPSPWGTTHVSGIVMSWGEFGYQADVAGGSEIVSDGSFDINDERLMATGFSMSHTLHDFELIGGRIELYQAILNGITGSWETQCVFRGIVSNTGRLGAAGMTIEFTGLFGIMGEVPPTEVTRVDFPDAPDESIGVPIPVLLGDWKELPNPNYPYMTSTHLQCFGMGNNVGVPIVPIDTNEDEDDKGWIYRIASHDLKGFGYGSGICSREPELEVPCNTEIPYADWDNGSGYCDIKTSIPEYAIAPITPVNKTPNHTAGSDGYKAWDLDPDTTITIITGAKETKILEGKLPNMPQLGNVAVVQVQCWIKGVGSGSCRLGLTDDAGNWVGDTLYHSFSPTAQERRVTHTIIVSGAPLRTWDWDQYNARIAVLASTTVEIVALGLAVWYVPNRRPAASRDFHGIWATWWSKPVFGGSPWEKTGRNPPTMCAYVEGLADDASGTYTGSANSLIENGADITHCLLGEYSDLESGDIVGSSEHGSFTAARTELGSYHKLAVWLGETKRPTKDVFRELCAECRAVPIQNSEGKVGMVVIDPTPSVDYRGPSDQFLFCADEHYRRDSFQCGRTPASEVPTRVYIEFDYCHQTGQFRKTTFVTESGSDDGTGTRDEQGGREDVASTAATVYNTKREFRLRAPHVYDPKVAVALRNYYFDSLCRPRLWIQFEAGRHACDLSDGNVIGLGDHMIVGISPPNPYEVANYWDDYKWYVESVIRVDGPDHVPSYRVGAIEATEPDTPADWVASN